MDLGSTPVAGKTVQIPSAAHDGDLFSLMATYRGGYSTTLSGTLSAQDLIASSRSRRTCRR